jgi:hypothetical protein
MTVVCWFYRSFTNSFTVCLIVSLMFQALLAVSFHFFLGQGRKNDSKQGKEQSLFYTR